MKKPRVFISERETAALLGKRLRAARLAAQAVRKAEKNKAAVRKVWADLLTLTRLVHAWARREYTVVPWQTLIAATAALIYFINPFDLIPDFLYAIGFVDDVAFITLVVATIRDDLERFRGWENAAANHKSEK